ncbi:sensor histidine kinase [Actinomadura fibrosa]|uniref:Sensor histidine kinase n=1 Tax=Actinomadura fibrosa TaxID=111802 RepID=A0ABW2XFB3_9ACTN|nr:sensor histidine kinase [Actinomadura fibrosa]
MKAIPRRIPDLDLEKIDRRGPNARPFMFWLVVLAWPLTDALKGRTHPMWPALLALLAFAVLHLSVIRTAFDGRVPLRVPVGLLVLQAGVATAAALAFQGRWYSMFPLLGLATGVVVGHTPQRRRGPEITMLLAIGGVSVLCALVIQVGGESGASVLAYWYGTVTAGLVTAVVLRLVTVIGLLRDAREELAEAAVARERLRFSRDLHDLMGHTLSLMVVKAQAVRRIVERDPTLAAEQAADIETVGRQALGEVRQAVTGYRGRGLAGELDSARTALSDSGVDVDVRRSGAPLPPEEDALLGWAVREGVTNVIRHSGARHCAITIRNEGDRAVLEVKDDGPGPRNTTGDEAGSAGSTDTGLDLGPGGHGLRGLRERMEAAEGTVAAGPSPDGGFLLKVTVPVSAPR